MDDLSPDLFSQFTDVKKSNPGLKTVIALGGWTFEDNGPATQPVFSDMVSTAANRALSIKKLSAFMRQYAFDGVDFDWEYPGATNRGDEPEDDRNFVTFLKELNEENDEQLMHYVVSFTVPTSFWYLKHFDLEAVDYVDFVNVMSYDLHGISQAIYLPPASSPVYIGKSDIELKRRHTFEELPFLKAPLWLVKVSDAAMMCISLLLSKR
jgi:chitinase